MWQTGCAYQCDFYTYLQMLDELTRALVLALGVCYHACLEKRQEYRNFIANYFTQPCVLSNGGETILQNISWSVTLQKMHLHCLCVFACVCVMGVANFSVWHISGHQFVPFLSSSPLTCCTLCPLFILSFSPWNWSVYLQQKILTLLVGVRKMGEWCDGVSFRDWSNRWLLGANKISHNN